MSSFAGYCRACGKPVMHKTLFGTLHICLTDEEIAAQTRAKIQQQANSQAVNKLKELLNPPTHPKRKANT